MTSTIRNISSPIPITIKMCIKMDGKSGVLVFFVVVVKFQFVFIVGVASR